ncbi:hypothetical protein, partial [Deinococcus sp. 43]|uniref:hypothetical protein n=1 Tax=Deinococcus sp. 43 TaxID=532020 RepID=UPI0024DE13BA
IGGFWDGHTPKTPPFVVPIRDRSYVQECCVQHSLNLKMSGTEKWNDCWINRTAIGTHGSVPLIS